MLVCPPFVTLPAVAAVAQGDPVLLGAQNCADQDKGAYTGEVSAAMLKEAGVRYVIVAHSERRQYSANGTTTSCARSTWCTRPA